MNPLEDDDALSRRGFLVGTAGAAAVAGASAMATAQEDANGENGDDATGDDNGDDTTGETGDEEANGVDAGPAVVEEVIVGAGGRDVFEPDSLRIEPGTTVRWIWDSDNHDVAPSSIPDESDWEGHTDLEDAGFEYEYTFDVEGTYEYVCTPHVGVGMVAEIEVGEGLGGAPSGPATVVPDTVWGLLIATVAGMVATLSLAFTFMRYGGGQDD